MSQKNREFLKECQSYTHNISPISLDKDDKGHVNTYKERPRKLQPCTRNCRLLRNIKATLHCNVLSKTVVFSLWVATPLANLDI